MMRGIAEYKAVNLGSASKEELVVMLFEAAIRHQIQASDLFDEDSYTEAREHLRLVREIFGELLCSLDHEVAPELSSRLSRLYTWLIGEVARAGMDKSSERLENTVEVCENLLEGWVQAFRNEGV
jgi:flagellar protein FliS